jgi:hypothetical protein
MRVLVGVLLVLDDDDGVHQAVSVDVGVHVVLVERHGGNGHPGLERDHLHAVLGVRHQDIWVVGVLGGVVGQRGADGHRLCFKSSEEGGLLVALLLASSALRLALPLFLLSGVLLRRSFSSIPILS